MFDGGMDAPEPTDPMQTARLVLTPVDAEDVDDLALLYADPIVALLDWTVEPGEHRGMDHRDG